MLAGVSGVALGYLILCVRLVPMFYTWKQNPNHSYHSPVQRWTGAAMSQPKFLA